MPMYNRDYIHMHLDFPVTASCGRSCANQPSYLRSLQVYAIVNQQLQCRASDGETSQGSSPSPGGRGLL